jgi:hypothetical protein
LFTYSWQEDSTDEWSTDAENYLAISIRLLDDGTPEVLFVMSEESDGIEVFQLPGKTLDQAFVWSEEKDQRKGQ